MQTTLALPGHRDHPHGREAAAVVRAAMAVGRRVWDPPARAPA